MEEKWKWPWSPSGLENYFTYFKRYGQFRATVSEVTFKTSLVLRFTSDSKLASTTFSYSGKSRTYSVTRWGLQLNALSSFFLAYKLQSHSLPADEDFTASTDDADYVGTLADCLEKRSDVGNVVASIFDVPGAPSDLLYRLFEPLGGDNRSGKNEGLERIVRIRRKVLPPEAVAIIPGSTTELETVRAGLRQMWRRRRSSNVEKRDPSSISSTAGPGLGGGPNRSPRTDEASMLHQLEEDSEAGALAQAVLQRVIRYYGTCCKQCGLQRYGFKIANVEYDTNVYTKPSFVRSSYRADTIPRPTLLGQQPALECTPSVRRLSDRLTKEIKVRDHDDPLYALATIDGTGKPLAFRLGTYFQWRLRWGALGDELKQKIKASKKSTGKDQAALPLRDALLPNLSAIAAIDRRFCAGGVGVLFAVRTDDGYMLLLQRRSNRVTDGRKLLALVPTSFHQPAVDPYEELRPYASVVRELYEEVYGGDDASRPKDVMRWDWFMGKSPAMLFLRDHPELWEATVTGFGFNATLGNYEFATVLRIHDVSFWNAAMEELKNWEVHGFIRLRLPQDHSRVLQILSQRDWTGESRFHFVQGLLYLCKVEPDFFRFRKEQLSMLLCT